MLFMTKLAELSNEQTEFIFFGRLGTGKASKAVNIGTYCVQTAIRLFEGSG